MGGMSLFSLVPREQERSIQIRKIFKLIATLLQTYSKFPVGSLDHMKAIQSIIDARRNMASSGTTYSPLVNT